MKAEAPSPLPLGGFPLWTNPSLHGVDPASVPCCPRSPHGPCQEPRGACAWPTPHPTVGRFLESQGLPYLCTRSQALGGPSPTQSRQAGYGLLPRPLTAGLSATPTLGGFISMPTWQQSSLTWLQVRALPVLGSPGPPTVLTPLLSPHNSLWAPHPIVAPSCSSALGVVPFGYPHPARRGH